MYIFRSVIFFLSEIKNCFYGKGQQMLCPYNFFKNLKLHTYGGRELIEFEAVFFLQKKVENKNLKVYCFEGFQRN